MGGAIRWAGFCTTLISYVTFGPFILPHSIQQLIRPTLHRSNSSEKWEELHSSPALVDSVACMSEEAVVNQPIINSVSRIERATDNQTERVRSCSDWIT